MAQAPASLSEGALDGLYRLLDDDDEQVFTLLRDSLLQRDIDIDRMLERAAHDDDPVRRRHAQKLLDEKFGHEAEDDFDFFLARHRGDIDLADALLRLARTEYPALSLTPYRERLAFWSAQLERQLGRGCDPEQGLSTLHSFFFEDLAFRGNEEEYYDPRNSYLTDVLDRRVGIPISLGAVYLILGQAQGLPLAGISMPGHFVIRFQSPRTLTYIDVFHQGRPLNMEQCADYCRAAGYGFQPEYMTPVTTREIVARSCSNLMLLYADRRDDARVRRFRRFLVRLGALPERSR